MKQYLTVEEVAARWRSHHSTVRRAIARDLPHVRLRRRVLIDLADLEAYESARRGAVAAGAKSAQWAAR